MACVLTKGFNGVVASVYHVHGSESRLYIELCSKGEPMPTRHKTKVRQSHPESHTVWAHLVAQYRQIYGTSEFRQ